MVEKVFLVARVSDVEQRKALPAQKKRLYDYANKKDWKEGDVFKYIEFDETAFKENRKTFRELVITPLEAAKEKHLVVFDKIDRFSRDSSSEERAALTKLFRAGKIELHFPSDNLFINKNSPAPDLFRLDIGVALAGYYSSAIRDNVKRRFEQMLNDGIWVHRAPMGYKNINTGTDASPIKDIVVDEDRAHHIVKAFELRAEGMPYSLIAKELVEAGYTSRKTGKSKLSKGDVEKIINNKFYYGVMVQSGKEYKHKYHPLVTRALFNRCQMMKDKRKSMKTKYDSMDFTFKDNVKCGKCGRSVSSFKSRNTIYLKCANPACKNPNTAESLVLGSVEAIVSRITIPDHLLERVIKELREKHDDQQLYYEQSLVTIRKEYDSIDKKLEDNYDNLMDGRITPERHDDYANKLTARQAELNEQLDLLTSGNKSFLITSSYLLDLANRAQELFKCSDDGLRSKLLGFLLSNIRLNDKKLSFTVTYPYNLILEQQEKGLSAPNSQIWCGLGDSNSWPLPWQGSALTTELNPHVVNECDYTEGKWLIQEVL